MADQYHSNGNGTASATIASASPLFSIVKKEVELVKPSKPTPIDIVLSFSTIDNDVNIDDIATSIFVHSKKSDTFANDNHGDQVDPALLIKEALSKALVHYYPFAGRLKRHHEDGKLRLTCNENGVPFSEAVADCTLSSLNYLDGTNTEVVKQFFFSSPPKDCPLVFQVTKFSCGGFVVSFGMAHAVADGTGAAQFFKAMAELSKGRTELSVKPVWERERLSGKPTEDLLEIFAEYKHAYAVSPYLPSSDISHETFSIKRELLKRLKEDTFTTVEALGAFVWRARARAMELNPNGKTSLLLTSGIRKVLNPPLPEGYYGNAIVSTVVDKLGKDLNEQPLSETAKLVKEKKRETLDRDFVRKYIDSLETSISSGYNVKIGANCAVMMLTDWRNLEFSDVEMGFGWNVVNVATLPWDMIGYADVCFLPPSKLDPSMEGGVRVLVSLPRLAMAKFKEEMDALTD